jgi:hypothetical protein
MKGKRTASVFLKYALMAWDQADEWKKGVRDVVLGGTIVSGIDDYLSATELT